MRQSNSFGARVLSRTRLGLLAVIGLAACNSDEQVSGIDRGGAPVATAVVTSGALTSFGSIVVNGARYETGNAEIIIDGAPGTEADLEIGQILVVRGEVAANGTRTALHIDFDDQLIGPIGSIDASAGQLSVLGQTVLVDPGTSFDSDLSPRTLEGLSVGDAIAVSGLVNADGVTVASRISPNDLNRPERVHGVVSDANPAAKSFRVNALTVDYSAATLESFAGPEPVNGDFVEVEGTASSQSQLVANRVSLEARILRDDDEGDLIGEIEGFITRFDSANDFDVDGLPVVASAQTQFELGDAADLALNARVQVTGTVDAANRLLADVVKFEPTAFIEIEAPVQQVDAASGTVVLLGILVRIDEFTRVEDQSDDDQRIFDLSDINVGDRLAIHGYEEPSGSNQVVATWLEREDDDDGFELQAIVQSLADPEFTILGVTILTTVDTEFDDVSRAEFFDEAVGQLVEVEGELSGQSLIAEEVEYEDDD